MITLDNINTIVKPHNDRIAAEAKADQLTKSFEVVLAALKGAEDYLLRDIDDVRSKSRMNDAIALHAEIRNAIARAQRARGRS
jgi:soluble lytic murein transglycosylase-like protein